MRTTQNGKSSEDDGNWHKLTLPVRRLRLQAMNEHGKEQLLPMNLRITVSPAPIRLWLMHTAA
jgi:hypothetical protein